jgi:ribosomal protein S18 acetylase RimI-like enzyme
MVISVRTARVEDAPAMARVFVDTFHAAHRGQIPDWLLLTRTYETSERGWTETIAELEAEAEPGECVLVAQVDAEKIVGVAICGPAKPWEDDQTAREARPAGEAYALYVDQEYQRRGVGREMVRGMARFLAGHGCHRLLIGTLAVNHPARSFYEAIDGRLVGQRLFDDEGVLLDEVVYAWDDIETLATPATCTRSG